MRQDGNKFYLSEGDIFDYHLDPNLSGAGFQIVRDGDGDQSTFVRTTGLASGDPLEVYVKKGALGRPVPVDLPGAEPDTDEVKAYKRSFVFVINGDGEKVTIGQWPEAQ